MRKGLEREIDRVVRNGNCSGCGGCAALTPRVSMVLEPEEGFMRPRVARTGADGPELRRRFKKVCPGVGVRAVPHEGGFTHPVFGRVESAWQGWATDADVRFRGSSGGVLTALTAWMIDAGIASSGICAGRGQSEPNRTVVVKILTREEALAASGSRYAPVANAAGYESTGVFVGKPCEVSAARGLDEDREIATENRPVKLSFFCAGTPSQKATDELVRKMGIDIDRVVALEYRGRGWPGRFEVEDRDGNIESMSYDDSWGRHLGRQLQWRCRICPDGTGAEADVSVGDYWAADARGFPDFEEGDGNSVVIARTARGHELLKSAVAAGVIVLRPVNLADVAAIQPLQVVRSRTVGARLVARRMTGHAVPRYRGFSLAVKAFGSPALAARQFVGTFVRSLRGRFR